MTSATAEIARLFGARAAPGANYGEEVYPGYPGLVVEGGTTRTMTWGFPLMLTGKQGQKLKPKPVNNAREDKLTTTFWRDSFVHRRCLIPVSAWAEAEGPKGAMTRTWYALPSGEPFACAGIWRPTHEWGDAYSMVMVDGCAQMADVHDRMPLMLHERNWAAWESAGVEDAMALCRTWDDELSVERTSQPWVTRR